MNLDLFKERKNQDGDGVEEHVIGTHWFGDSVGTQRYRDEQTEIRPVRLRGLYK